MKKFVGYLALASLVLSFGVGINFAAGDKVTICHIPPGNPANAHEITVDAHAIPAHLAHGDNLGSCVCTPDRCPPPPPCDQGGDCRTGSTN